MTDTRKETDSAETIDIEGIIKLLPHRYPFILVDRILEVASGESIVGLKNVTINEPFFQGHFPTRPIMPGVLILEGMAQAGGLLAYITEQDMVDEKLIYFAGMDGVRFRQPVEILHPGLFRFLIPVSPYHREQVNRPHLLKRSPVQ